MTVNIRAQRPTAEEVKTQDNTTKAPHFTGPKGNEKEQRGKKKTQENGVRETWRGGAQNRGLATMSDGAERKAG